MAAEPTIDECLEAIEAKDEEIERLQSLVGMLKGASNDLRRCLVEFVDSERWFPAQRSAPSDVVWEWNGPDPTDIAYRALRRYDESLKTWDDTHPTGAERLRLQ